MSLVGDRVRFHSIAPNYHRPAIEELKCNTYPKWEQRSAFHMVAVSNIAQRDYITKCDGTRHKRPNERGETKMKKKQRMEKRSDCICWWIVLKTYTCLVGISTYVAGASRQHCTADSIRVFSPFFFFAIRSAMQETTQFIMDLISITRNHNAIRNLCETKERAKKKMAEERGERGVGERERERETDAGVLL